MHFVHILQVYPKFNVECLSFVMISPTGHIHSSPIHDSDMEDDVVNGS